MQKLLKSFAFAVSLTAAVVTGPAHAIFGVGDIVIDPTNLIQNTYSALSAVKNEVNTANTYINQVQQLIAIGKSLQSMNGLSNLTGAQQELALYTQLSNIGGEMITVMDRSRKLAESLQAQVGASNMDWATFLSTKSDIERARKQSLANQMVTIDKNMADVAKRRSAIVNQLQASSGQTSAMQAVGAGIDVLIGQNQQMIANLQLKGREEQAKERVDAATVNQGLKVISERQLQLLKSSSELN
jgi:conjugal transfer/entry exclusion protein